MRTFPSIQPPPSPCLVALSGGADSVALLLLLHERGIRITAAHCNFHLRGAESDRDETFVRQLCEGLGVPLHVQHFDTAGEAEHTGESIEMAARRLRYAWFQTLMQQTGCRAVAVAHHMDDNAETLLLNLMRGTGLRGLTGMDAAHEAVVRPLLAWSRADVLAFLEERRQTYVDDSTNADVHYRRNFVRHKLLPLMRQVNPHIAASLHHTAHRLQQAEALYLDAVHRWLDTLVQPTTYGTCIALDALQASPSPEALLHEWLAPCGFSATQTAAALHMAVGRYVQSGQWLCVRSHAHLELTQQPLPTPPRQLQGTEGSMRLDERHVLTWRTLPRTALQHLPSEPHVAALDAALLQAPLSIRRPQEADRFVPLGMRGSQLLSNFFTNRHLSRAARLHAWLLTDAEGIVWVVGQRLAQRAALTEHTHTVLLLQVQPCPAADAP